MSVAHDVRIENVTKRFQDVTAVDNLTLEIESGKFFALLGPSGCGKTTTLSISSVGSGARHVWNRLVTFSMRTSWPT